MEIIKEHLIEYLVLFVAIVVFVVLFVVYRFDKSSLILISAIGSVFYILWGIIHHALRERLTRNILWEYIVFGLLIFLLFYTVLSF